MYNDEIKVANKIISYDDLNEIFLMMNEKLFKYKKIGSSEDAKNKILSYDNQIWTFKDNGSTLKFSINFYDDTSIKIDDYNNFVGIFNNRVNEIKSIYVYFNLNYSVKNRTNNDYRQQHIYMYIYEDKLKIDVSLLSSDDKINDVYEFIKMKISNSLVKYNKIIKNRTMINCIISLAIGYIPSIIITIFLMFISTIREFFIESYVLFPVCCTVLALLLGGIISSTKLDRLYKNIVPEKKYAGYDRTNNKSIYKDDISKYIETGEILIGKNTNNLEYRREIEELYNKCKKYLLYETIVVLLCSFIIILFK